MISLPDLIHIDQTVAPCAPSSAEPEPSEPQPGSSGTQHENEEPVPWSYNNRTDPVSLAIKALLEGERPGPRTGPGKGKIKYRRNAICFEGLPD